MGNNYCLILNFKNSVISRRNISKWTTKDSLAHGYRRLLHEQYRLNAFKVYWSIICTQVFHKIMKPFYLADRYKHDILG